VSLARRLAAEALGTAFLLAVVVGSGIMGERLAGGNTAIALLANSLATGAGLVAFILAFDQMSAHFNPAVTLVESFRGGLARKDVAAYLGAQTFGAVAGVAGANAMFDEPIFAASQHVRSGFPQWFAEFVATFGLIAIIVGCARARPAFTAYAVGAYITGAYWFTSSTSFANPAVTFARAMTNTFSGIRPADVPAFIVAQLAGAAASAALFQWLLPPTPNNES